MNDILANHVEASKALLLQKQIEAVREKDINYGHQVVFSQGGQEITVNFYYGKKGLSTVIQGKDSVLKTTIGAALQAVPAASAKKSSGAAAATTAAELAPPGVQSWIGCDESGKGDVFGPLVGAACAVTREEAALFRSRGVCDSKALTDTAIAKLASMIRDTLQDRCEVRVLMPQEYNSLYEENRRKHKNLNHLLGSLHARNIRVLLSKYNCPCIIVDKFGKDEYVLAELAGLEKSHQVIQVTKGERDTAVAAASILARQAFVQAMEDMQRRFGIAFPKGAYLGISETMQQMIDRYGTEALVQVGKLNFKNFDFLR
jgi:ribonuclease HIII